MRTPPELLMLLLSTHCYAGDLLSHSNAPAPVLKVDNEHSTLHAIHFGTNAPPYRIHASPKVFIDATNYRFDMPVEVRGKPLTDLSLMGGSTNLYGYQLAWKPGKTRYELSGTTLRAFDESPAFDGFKTGQTWSLWVGAAQTTNKSLTVWAGTIEVR